MTASLPPVYVIDGARTPFLKARTGPGPFSASDLAVKCGQALLKRQSFDAPTLDEVILGCIGPSPDEVNIGRVVALRLGCGDKVPAWTVQRNCASGMQAIDSAARSIMTGRSQLVLAGGTEAMSHAPILWGPEMVAFLAQWMGAKTGPQRLKLLGTLRPQFLKPVIALLRGLTDPVVGLSMGQTAEVLAKKFSITRTQMDEFAVQSHLRLTAAQAEGRLNEIFALVDDKGAVYDHDDGVRPDSAVAKLAKLKPVFDRPFGHVTAGNSAQITDGASWLILASEQAVKAHNLQPIGRIVDTEWAGLDPRQMGLGPVHASAPMLARHQLKLSDIAFWEINEAFAAQVLACLAAFKDTDYCRNELGLDGALGEVAPATLNVDAASGRSPEDCAFDRQVKVIDQDGQTTRIPEHVAVFGGAIVESKWQSERDTVWAAEASELSCEEEPTKRALGSGRLRGAAVFGDTSLAVGTVIEVPGSPDRPGYNYWIQGQGSAGAASRARLATSCGTCSVEVTAAPTRVTVRLLQSRPERGPEALPEDKTACYRPQAPEKYGPDSTAYRPPRVWEWADCGASDF